MLMEPDIPDKAGDLRCLADMMEPDIPDKAGNQVRRALLDFVGPDPA
jgi:hypothetical protein